MRLIVGLGNPEDQENFKNTRHNMGFNTVNKLAEKYNIDISKRKFDGLVGEGEIEGEKVIILKPQTYMNESGVSILQLVNFYKIDTKDMIVVYDDVDTPLGSIKLRKSGGAGTHNGMKSVVYMLDTTDFIHVRIGIGMPKYKGDMINYVIGNIPEEEKEILDKETTTAAEAIIECFKNGVDIAMNKFNGDV